MDDEQVFKALADPHRRRLLDLLFECDGQSLSELDAQFEMTRFGVMKHLGILEEAGLISTRKQGREKRHYLNPVPIQQVYERWVSKYAQPWAAGLNQLKQVMEGVSMEEKQQHIYHIFIRTTPEKLWQALTDGGMSALYYFGTAVDSSWEAGADYVYRDASGAVMIEGKVIEVEAPRRAVMSFRPLWAEGEASRQFSTVTWEIEPRGELCKLTLIHEGLDLHSAYGQEVVEGWAMIFAGLKTLLETGEAMASPA